MQKPRFFLSSTIYDFKDLRSALKFYLEQQGCHVAASEYTDFKISAEKHSYDSCLENIKNADYFILLIGGRVGGWYDKINSISITQQEYRTAYSLHQKGQIKILIFVRSEIWEHRENRLELKRYLETINLKSDVKSSIGNHASKICDDSKFIIDFINEVSRVDETKKVLSGTTKSLPTGNWIYSFQTFREVVDAIQSQIISDVPLEQSAIKHLLHLEVKDNLKASLFKLKKYVTSPEICVTNFHIEHQLTLDDRNNLTTSVDAKRWGKLSIFGFHLIGLKLQTRILEHCLRTSIFVDYDPMSGKTEASSIQKDLLKLSSEIEKFHLANTSDVLEIIFQYSPKNGYTGDTPVSIPTLKLLALLHLYDRWINIIKLSSASAKYLSGMPYSSPLLRPRSPIPDLNLELDEETITEEELNKFLAEDAT